MSDAEEPTASVLPDRQSMTPREVWAAIGVSKQAATKLMKPLLDPGLVRRLGSQKSGRYILG
jgi:predicted HTH transcriptional regulator